MCARVCIAVFFVECFVCVACSMDPHFLRYGGILKERLPYDSRYRNSIGTKMAVSFANIFMSVVDPKIIETSSTKPLEWKRYNHWQCPFFMRSEKRGNWPLYLRSKEAQSQHQVQVQVLDTTTFNGERFLKESVLDVGTYLIQLKLFSALISPPVTQQAWQKTSSKRKRSDFLRQGF